MTAPEPSQRDGLTGTASMQALLRFADAALELQAPDGPRVALLCVDVEELGVINRKYGLSVGDAVLLGVADLLREGLRGNDLVGRWGGGFAICLPEVFGTAAAGAAERLRRSILDTALPTPIGRLPVSASLGLALAAPGERAAALFQRARDAALAAKQAGGGQVRQAG